MPTKSTTPKPNAPPRPAAAPAERKLSPAQELVLDFAADLVMNGGVDEDLSAMLDAIAIHYERRVFEQPMERRNSDGERRHVADWRREIMRNWPAKPPELEAGKPGKTASDRVRWGMRWDLAEYLQEFIYGATPEEVRLMHMVVGYWKSCYGHALFSEAFIPLAEAMSHSLERRRDYILAKPGHHDLIRAYIAHLEKGDEKKAA